MNKSLLAAVVSGALALPMAAQVQADEAEVQPHSHAATYEHAHEMDDGSMSPLHAHQHDAHPHAELHGHSSTLYGSVRSGIIVQDSGAAGSDATWDLGSVDAGDLGSGDRLWSRIGVDASTDLGGGLVAGLKIEKRLDGFRTRHQNVWLEGAFGRFTLGQQGSPYQAAASWDGANFTGGNFDLAHAGSRRNGITYSSSLGGPFNFKAMIADDNGPSTSTAVVHTGTMADGDFAHEDVTTPTSSSYGEGVDGFEVSGTLDAGPVTINVGYADNDAGTAVVGVTAGGSFGALGWEVGFETSDPDVGEDSTRTGFFVDYGIGDGAVYFYYEDGDNADPTPVTLVLRDNTAWVVGYSHSLGSGVSVIGEHRDREIQGTTSILGVVVGF